MAINLTAKQRDTYLRTKTRDLPTVGGSLLLSGIPGNGYITLTGGDLIILSSEFGIVKNFTFTAAKRDTYLQAGLKNG